MLGSTLALSEALGSVLEPLLARAATQSHFHLANSSKSPLNSTMTESAPSASSRVADMATTVSYAHPAATSASIAHYHFLESEAQVAQQNVPTATMTTAVCLRHPTIMMTVNCSLTLLRSLGIKPHRELSEPPAAQQKPPSATPHVSEKKQSSANKNPPASPESAPSQPKSSPSPSSSR